MIKVVVFQGPSGSGKSTLQEKLGIPRIITWTTRAPRPNERNGIDYHFVSIEEFKQMHDAGSMLEVTEYKANYYGTSLDSFKNLGNEVRSIVVDPSGANKIKEIMKDECFRIGVYASKLECESRLLQRNPSVSELINRLRDYDSEVQSLFDCDIVINNSDVNFEKAERIISLLSRNLVTA
jgi:guanylate kinase